MGMRHTTTEEKKMLPGSVRRREKMDKIARAFSDVLKEWLTENEMETIVRRNEKQEDDLICHTHDFCDANEAMLMAFEIAIGREAFLCSDVEAGRCTGPEEDEDILLWNDAWNWARENDFFLTQIVD